MDSNDKLKAAAKSQEELSRLKRLGSSLPPPRIPQASSSSTSPLTQTVSPLDSRDPASSSLSTTLSTLAAESPQKWMLREQASLSRTTEKVSESRESSPRRAPYSRPQVLPHPGHVQHVEHQHHHNEKREQEDAQGYNWYSPTCLVITGALLAFLIVFIVFQDTCTCIDNVDLEGDETGYEVESFLNGENEDLMVGNSVGRSKGGYVEDEYMLNLEVEDDVDRFAFVRGTYPFACVWEDVDTSNEGCGVGGELYNLCGQPCLWEDVDTNLQVPTYFYNNAISFNVVKDEEFIKMCEMITQYGKGYKPPSYHDIRGKYLKKKVESINSILVEHKAAWKKFGCTIMTDGWFDQKRRTIINFLVNSPMGTFFFLKSIDASSISKTADKVFKMMDDIVEEVGEENVVQIVTDNAANYKLAGQMLMDKRNKLYWTPCAAHCIDLMLEDFESKIPMHKEIIASGKKITAYIYARTGLITLLHHYTEGVLRMVDSDEKATMDYIYEAMDQAKEEIQTSYNNNRKSYQSLWKIIDNRWDKQLHRPLHAAGYYLNPLLYYNPNFIVDNEVKQGMYACLERMMGGDMDMVNKIDGQLEDFKSKKGFFGSEIAQRGLKNKTPTQWWESYGDAHPELQNFAIRVLSLTCSSSAVREIGVLLKWFIQRKEID
ncbi:hypothetical protein KIW84_023793 [Lathyrus oleraceus]|uniref:DUF659 domain-containing protein n=1 Tax=Pisum sativum TaxID=3888 RepID=A0A9D4YFW8_PEA|nr:hypothetical protein KIW84_023793 [Pisum sativum]